MPMGPKGFPVAPLQELFHKSGLTYSEIAHNVGWMRSDYPTRADGSRVARALGLYPSMSGINNRNYKSKRISYERAEKLVRAMGFDPVDVGL